MFRFLYFSGLVRRNSFVNVVFAVGDMAKVWFRVPKWLRFMGFACMESGVFEVGLFRFRLKKKEGRLTTFPC